MRRRNYANMRAMPAEPSDSNDLGQPVGRLLPGWTPRPRPTARPMAGRWCRLEPLEPSRHAEDLFRANSADRDGRMWTYLPYGPFANLASYRNWLTEVADHEDPVFFAVRAGHGPAVGLAALLRIEPAVGSLEVGHVAFSPVLQGTTAATEAMALLMRLVFDELGYRRYEWKCHSLNAASRRAAQRFGFSYEGTFRQAVVVKGRNRDTAWFAITDAEWPRLAAAYQRWLAPENFDAAGRQRLALSTLTGSAAPRQT